MNDSGDTVRINRLILSLAVPLLFGISCTSTQHGHRPAECAEDHGGGVCHVGNSQSPIDIYISATEKAALTPLQFEYKASNGVMVNNGHSVQVNLTDAGSALLVNNSRYNLTQFHFHTPSEERINGLNYPMVIHMVHQNAVGGLAVVAVLVNEGKENQALKQLFTQLPTKKDATSSVSNFDSKTILPTNRSYFAYAGSLTTPPYSEGVAWHVLQNPIEMSAAQINAFRNLYRSNARAIQPLNGRKVYHVLN